MILERTSTGAGRIKGLLPNGTVVGHKTGTTGNAGALNGSTNDVGVIVLTRRRAACGGFLREGQHARRGGPGSRDRADGVGGVRLGPEYLRSNPARRRSVINVLLPMSNPFRGRIRWALIGWMFVISAIAYLDRVNISIAGHSIQQEFHLDNIQLGWVFQRVCRRICALSSAGRTAGGPLWPAKDSGAGHGLVGRLHGADGAGAVGRRQRAVDPAVGPILSGSGRGGSLSRFQPAGGGVDSFAGTRPGERD